MNEKEIASLQEQISILKNQLATEAQQYESTSEMKEAQNNQLQESISACTTKLVLKTKECNTLEEKVKDASKVHESLVKRLQNRNEENETLKRKFNGACSEIDSLRKRLKRTLEAPQTLVTVSDVPSLAMEKSATEKQPYSEESFIFSHQTGVDNDDEESCDDDDSVSSSDESTSSDTSMSDNETEFSSL